MSSIITRQNLTGKSQGGSQRLRKSRCPLMSKKRQKQPIFVVFWPQRFVSIPHPVDEIIEKGFHTSFFSPKLRYAPGNFLRTVNAFFSFRNE